MQASTTVTELRCFLNMVNQLGKFTTQLADLTQPLWGLLSKGNIWLWGTKQSDAFNRLKEELSKPTTLTLYNLQTPTKLSADASSYRLGAVLLEESGGQPGCICITLDDRDGVTLWANRKLGLWKVLRLYLGSSDRDWDRSETSRSSPDEQAARQPTAPSPSLPPSYGSLHIHIHHVPGKNIYTANNLSQAPPSTTEHDQDLKSWLSYSWTLTPSNIQPAESIWRFTAQPSSVTQPARMSGTNVWMVVQTIINWRQISNRIAL